MVRASRSTTPATTETRYSWPVSASATVIARAVSHAGVMSPNPVVVIVMTLKYSRSDAFGGPAPREVRADEAGTHLCAPAKNSASMR